MFGVVGIGYGLWEGRKEGRMGRRKERKGYKEGRKIIKRGRKEGKEKIKKDGKKEGQEEERGEGKMEEKVQTRLTLVDRFGDEGSDSGVRLVPVISRLQHSLDCLRRKTLGPLCFNFLVC